MPEATLRRQYSKEYKEEAVKLVLKGEKTCREIAEYLGIRDDQLHRWKKKYQQFGSSAFPGIGNLHDAQEAKIRQLETELRIVKEERAILKKAMAVFSRNPQ